MHVEIPLLPRYSLCCLFPDKKKKRKLDISSRYLRASEIKQGPKFVYEVLDEKRMIFYCKHARGFLR